MFLQVLAGAQRVHTLLPSSVVDPLTLSNIFEHFRILIIGRANAGKTTILQRVCKTREDPDIYDNAGKKIDSAVLMASREHGVHDIENEIVFRSNPGFIFHDSRGFEAGGHSGFDKVNNFIARRSQEKRLSDRIHVIW
ncbi:hypothetical protein CY34DRAFT_407847 [Suillus luteus UH-Slu-Lm8-n1]|uniref:G domain-containing protein n=1 Tax=Suillus luteus UH-Slu-Lm8-n1 TaxID=930992 RepID=A0A0D0AUV2_9AGAM|nr:hypothetical protein CY34DRAFT_407847 [Suillus luteus UH-Slu-Lm8-n1]